jgi:glutamate dehydrogenase (NADP+)
MSRLSSATQAVLNEVLQRNPAQPEFHQAVTEVLSSVDAVIAQHPEFDKAGILKRIVEPERVILFRVPWIDDRGQVQVNRGMRVQFNSALGPYKGGLRFHSSVHLGIIKFLGFEQMFKNALTTMPMGGGKGGSDFNPRGKSDGEVMRFCQSFMSELFRHVGPNVDVPAGDIGVGGREIGYLFGQYKRLTSRFEGVLTGKGLTWGGSHMRPEATGYGAVYFAEQMLADHDEELAGKTVAISGYGNLGTFAIEKLNDLGAKVVTVADEESFVYEPDGIRDDRAAFLRDLWQVYRRPLSDYAEKFNVELRPGRPWSVNCDIAMPTAAQNEILLEDAQQLVANGCRYVVEGANMPCTADAVDFLQARGVDLGPGKAANAGGVAVSGLEMSQNAMLNQWTRDEVDEKLQQIMTSIYQTCRSTAEQYGHAGDLVRGANIAGFLRVAQAMLEQGVV